MAAWPGPATGIFVSGWVVPEGAACSGSEISSARRKETRKSDPLHLLQFDRDQRMHELVDVAAEDRDFAHQRGRNEGELFLRREEHRLQFAMQVPAHVRELKLE